VKETKDVYEGEVTEVTPVETDNPLGGYGKTLTHVLIGLKTSKGSKQLKLDPSVYDSLVKQRIETGDVIYIESTSGVTKRVGRCDAYATEYDLEADEFVPLPKGDVHKRKEVVQHVTLHDLDISNARPQHSENGDMQTILNQLVKPKKTEITERLRSEINKVVDGYIDDGIAELHPGVLFIDEAHMLDMECFTFLHRALESRVAPIVVLATNRGVCSVNGSSGMQSPHGIPSDLLDRLLIVQIKVYSPEEVEQILRIRAVAEQVNIDDNAMTQLANIGAKTSLRYAVQLLSPAMLMARVHARDIVTAEDINECRAMFLDAKTSAQHARKEAKGSDEGADGTSTSMDTSNA